MLHIESDETMETDHMKTVDNKTYGRQVSVQELFEGMLQNLDFSCGNRVMVLDVLFLY